MLELVEAQHLELKLFWAPGHFDKVRPKCNRAIPDVFFVLNHCADYFAGIAAESVQLDMNCVSGVLYRSNLVNKIQKRLVRVLVSCPEKAKYDRKILAPHLLSPRLAISLALLSIIL